MWVLEERCGLLVMHFVGTRESLYQLNNRRKYREIPEGPTTQVLNIEVIRLEIDLIRTPEFRRIILTKFPTVVVRGFVVVDLVDTKK
jgi:hypothetical protein